jgi:MFS family permease
MNPTETTPNSTLRRSPFLLPVLFAPVFMVILDVFIVNVTAPSLRADIGASESDLQWVVAAYLLTYAISLITGGRLGDVFGRRRMFKLGIAGFTIASALCAAAPDPTTLIAARLLQGFGGAAMWPQVLSIIQVEFPPAERPKAFGFQGLVQGLAAIAGQIVGGGLIALDVLGLGWRSVFLINIPVGIVALFAADRLIPESRSGTARRIDLTGVGLATLVLTLVMVPAVEGRDLGWPAWTFAAFAAAVPAAGLFVYLPQVGATVAALGLIATIAAVQATGEGSVSAWLIMAMVPVGGGLGLAIPPLINTVLRAVPPSDAGAASGMLVTSQQIGNALGVAIIGTIFFGQLGSATGAGSYGDAFSVALGVQAAFALAAAALVSRARQTVEERVPGGVPTREGAAAR